MKIQTIQRRINRLSIRCLAICLASLVGLAASEAVAQSALLDYIASNPNSQSQRAYGGSRQITNGGEAYRVVGASSVQTVGDAGSTRVGDLRGPIGSAISGQRGVRQAGSVRQAGCNSCGNACGGSCGSYSAHSMGGYGGGMACGIPCDPYWYVLAEGLYMERDREDTTTFMRDFRTESFDFEWAPRITVGSVPDCVHGCEFTWVGPLEWDRSVGFANTAGGLSSTLIPGLPLVAADLSAFNDSTLQLETYSTEYWSAEANKTLIGWDVAKVLYGARYINYDEEFSYSSTNTSAESGQLRSNVDNRLIGLQVGMDLHYPIGRFVYTDFRARGGLFLNFAEADTRLVNAGNTIVAGFDEDEELAAVFELGSGFLYQLGEAFAIRGGAEMWYISGVATAPDQFRPTVTPLTGRNIRADDDIFIYGLTLGAELRL